MYNAFYDVEITTVVQGTEDLPRHSEATVLELKDKSLLIAWQRHEKSKFGGGDQAPSTISLMNSYDNGKTWENFRVAAGMIEGCVNVYSPSLYRNMDGTITLFFKRYMSLQPGKVHEVNYYRIDSGDEGKTWSEEKLLWERKPYAPLNHSAKRTLSGATLLPLCEGRGGWCAPNETHLVSVLRSEDDLKTWTQSNEICVPMRGLMEPCISQQANGRLNMVMRTQLGSVFYSESYDDGRTWSKPQPTSLKAPESCPCTATIPGTDVQIIVWNNSEYDMHWRSHYGKRTPLTMALSRDGLRTFTDFIDLETDPMQIYTNPAITITSDGLCVLTYWNGRYHEDGRMGAGYISLKLATFRVKI